ncbi:hypothetical protein EON81_09170 [bacterium]|nr:MAG: hypothetical protein EON81_09170 [bacterium]
MLSRLDHFILEVPDIEVAHQAWLGQGLSEAWPIGPFWPSALTSGIALGGVNLELVQPIERDTKEIHTLVFEPTSIAVAYATLFREGLKPRIAPKVETDPELLALRGFPESMRVGPQRICTNVIPDGDPALDFFLCEYAPLLKERLVKPDRDLLVEVALPKKAMALLRRLGGCPGLRVVEEGPQRVLAIQSPLGRLELS